MSKAASLGSTTAMSFSNPACYSNVPTLPGPGGPPASALNTCFCRIGRRSSNTTTWDSERRRSHSPLRAAVSARAGTFGRMSRRFSSASIFASISARRRPRWLRNISPQALVRTALPPRSSLWQASSDRRSAFPLPVGALRAPTDLPHKGGGNRSKRPARYAIYWAGAALASRPGFPLQGRARGQPRPSRRSATLAAMEPCRCVSSIAILQGRPPWPRPRLPAFSASFCLSAPEGRLGARAWALRGLAKTPRAPERRKRTEGIFSMRTPKSDKDRVLIFDTTLRDGEQSPGATMTHEEKLEVAELLDQMGIDVIEAGFPIASQGDFEAVQEIARRTKNAVVCGLSRTSALDIDRCAEAIRPARRGRIHTFVATSPVHMKWKLQMEPQQVY